MRRPRFGSSGKTVAAVFIFALLVIATNVIPGLHFLRLPIPIDRVRAGQTSSSAVADSDIQQGSPAHAAVAREASVVPGRIEDSTGHALDHFFAALARCEAKNAQVRICHYGDSPITNDGITSTVRRRLQLRFGDAGHGFVLIARPWAWYGHADVLFEPGAGWESDPLFISRGSDGMYGLGCVSFTAHLKNVAASFGTVTGSEVGKSVSSFDIYYLAQPGGGSFAIEVDGEHEHEVSTASDATASGFYRVVVAEGPHRITIKTVGDGEVRLFGVVLASSVPGVQYDSLGLNGAFIGLLANYVNEAHWVEQLRHRNPDLVILNYGANESEFESLPMDRYQKDTREAIRRIKAAMPDASVLLVGPMDRAKRGAGGAIVTRSMIPKLAAYQRRLATETGCAFFDTFTAMGGDGTVARWREQRPQLMGGDFTHPTAQGAEIVGNLIYDAITRAYDERRSECCPNQ
ncbi:MAG TPA: GDSL-type esterase/lipase family protein [Blastocatellia bacterium]|nr:GDSL-type esterase/lipase family protein [Blastocatellia bacterium]